MSFACQRCGNCCRWPGQVRVSPEECDAIAARLGVPTAAFIARWTRLAEDRRSLVLAEQPGGACVFLDATGACAIQSVKPRQCGEFPLTWNAGPEHMQRCPGWRAWHGDPEHGPGAG